MDVVSPSLRLQQEAIFRVYDQDRLMDGSEEVEAGQGD